MLLFTGKRRLVKRTKISLGNRNSQQSLLAAAEQVLANTQILRAAVPT